MCFSALAEQTPVSARSPIVRDRPYLWAAFSSVAAALCLLAWDALSPSAAADQTTVAQITKLVVDKSDGVMTAYSGGRIVARYRVAVGAGEGPKLFEGDKRTPEGSYKIDSRHPSKRFHRFLHVSYPNQADRERYAQLQVTGEVPAGAGIGSAIGVHGTPRFLEVLPTALRGKWTRGCIAVTNAEAEELYATVVEGAEIVIRQ